MRKPVLLLACAAMALGGAIAHARLVAPEVADAAITGEGFPRTLEEYGFFVHADAQIPTIGVVPYELNTPLFSDGADKLRFIYVPDGEAIEANADGLLQFPVGSAIIKTFAFGEGADRQLIETRVLLHRADGWLALPYRWNEEQTEAKLTLAGARMQITTPDGEEISYRIPNKNQCKSCHSDHGEITPIGPKARNMPAEWLQGAHDDGRLDRVPEVLAYLPEWDDSVAPNAEQSGSQAETAALARAYLDVNCAHCHMPGGGASNSGLDLRWEQDEPFALGVRKPPVAAGRGAGGLLVSIEPGQPNRSILVHRMDSAEPGVAMPELGRSTIDRRAVALMRDWIAGMAE